MRVTLNELLALVGRLDDTPGFDTPRERFRRFLFERVTDASALGALIEEGQHSLGEQHRRAVQDALVVLGRFLGFETTFGSYQRVAGALKFDGQWRSRHRLEVTLEVRTDETPRTDVEQLTRSLSALPPASRLDVDLRRIGLCVITPLYGDRARLEEELADDRLHPDIRVASVRSLVWLAEAASAGHLRHDEIVRLLTWKGSLDFIVDLMKRIGGSPTEVSAAMIPEIVSLPAAPAHDEASYWRVTIDSDEATTPEQFIASVIGKRQLLGVGETANGAHLRPRSGDWVCFSLRGKGIVGQGQIDSMADGVPRLRAAHRFGAVFTLKNVDIYDAPLAVGPDATLDRMMDRSPAEGAGPSIAALSPEEFSALTAMSALLSDRRSEGLRSAS